MTPGDEQLYLRTLHDLVATGLDFCLIGTFALRLHCPALPRHLVHDCDLMLPAQPAQLTALVQHLHESGWQVTLWDEPVQLPLTAVQLAGKYYLRARQAGAILDCAYENDYRTWPEFVSRRQWQRGLPVLSAEEIVAQKRQLGKPAGQAVIRLYQQLAGLSGQENQP